MARKWRRQIPRAAVRINKEARLTSCLSLLSAGTSCKHLNFSGGAEALQAACHKQGLTLRHGKRHREG